MRWITYLESNKEAYESFEADIQAKIKHFRDQLEDWRLDPEQLKFTQGCVSVLRQILLELEESQKESQSHGYGTNQQRAGPS
ncbi:hypothetical protein LCGC14_0690120 [marine sediment metagenome]|uniref:Uncharacterized protein n=1 Tax=marine sediment metagenome TaxID=412755 RepID=A0A0F9TTL8_9ZZZZ|nr:hypothetical protein [Candidatus Aminicenantes bacterium]